MTMKIIPPVCILCGFVTLEVVAVEVLSYLGARKEHGLCGFGLFVAYTLHLKSVFNTNS